MVIDIGDSNIRMGYAGDEKPRIKLNSIFAKKIKNVPSLNESLGEIKEGLQHIKQIPGKSSLLFGDELLLDKPYYSYKRIFDVSKNSQNENNSENSKIAKNFDIFSEMYADELCPRMSLDPKNHPLVAIEPSKNDKSFRKAIATMMIKSGIPKIFLIKKAAANLYACGMSTGVVLESGGQRTKITPVENGYVLQDCFAFSSFGGDRITQAIASEIKKEQNFIPKGLLLAGQREDYDPSFFQYLRYLKAEDIKFKLLGSKATQDQLGAMEEEYILPDGTGFGVSERVQKLTNCLFAESRMDTVRLCFYFN